VSPADDPVAEGRPRWELVRAALTQAGFRPSKSRGQNFLVDTNAARSIARDAGLGRGEWVLEVGAGCGFLTLHLVELGLEVLAVEIDARLQEVAARLLGERASVRWLVTDALASKHRLDPGLEAALPRSGPWHLVANLPYSISAPLLVVLARLPNPPHSMTVLVQEEVAARIADRAGGPAWGALGARLALQYRARAGRAVGAQLFWPRPRVASRVVHLSLAPLEALGPQDLRAYDRLVEALFQQRRKQLLGCVADLMGGREAARDLLAALGLDPRLRGEALAPRQLLDLARRLPVPSLPE